MNLSRKLSSLMSLMSAGDVPGEIVPFASFMPDKTPLGSPGNPNIINAVPTPNGYAPFKAFSAVASSALTGTALGLVAAQTAGGAVSVFAGDDTKLYSIDAAGGVSDVSRASGYDGADDGNWEFALDGQTVIATNLSDAVQGFVLGSSSVFADHFTSTNVPKARHLDIIRGDFLVLANTQDGTDGSKPSRVWWSALGDTKDMDPNASTQADYNDTKGVGWAQKVVGGVEYGLIFFENGIERMSYVGGGEIFRFDRIDRKRGTPIPNSVIAHGRRVFFISEEGFMVTHGTGESQHIGHGRVDKWFWDQFDVQYRSKVSAAIDPLQKLVLWGFPGTGNSGGTPNILVIYNWAEDKWGEAEITHEILLRSMTQGLTLDELDSIAAALDSLPFSLDSRAWTGGLFKLAGFDTTHTYGFYDGANLQATLETSEQMFRPGQFSHVTGMMPLVDGASTMTGQIGWRNRQVDSATFSTADGLNSDGLIPADISARYHRGRLIIPASTTWTSAQGVQFIHGPEGLY